LGYVLEPQINEALELDLPQIQNINQFNLIRISAVREPYTGPSYFFDDDAETWEPLEAPRVMDYATPQPSGLTLGKQRKNLKKEVNAKLYALAKSTRNQPKPVPLKLAK